MDLCLTASGIFKDKRECVLVNYAMIPKFFFIFKTEASSAVSSGAMNVSSVVSMATKAVSVGGDIGLQGLTAWLLGRLYLSSCSLTENKSAGKTKLYFL